MRAILVASIALALLGCESVRNTGLRGGDYQGVLLSSQAGNQPLAGNLAGRVYSSFEPINYNPGTYSGIYPLDSRPRDFAWTFVRGVRVREADLANGSFAGRLASDFERFLIEQAEIIDPSDPAHRSRIGRWSGNNGQYFQVPTVVVQWKVALNEDATAFRVFDVSARVYGTGASYQVAAGTIPAIDLTITIRTAYARREGDPVTLDVFKGFISGINPANTRVQGSAVIPAFQGPVFPATSRWFSNGQVGYAFLVEVSEGADRIP